MADFDEMLEKSKKTTDEPLHSNRADGLSVNDKDASLSVFGGQFDFANADIFKDVLDAPEQEHPEEDKVSELPSYLPFRLDTRQGRRYCEIRRSRREDKVRHAGQMVYRLRDLRR